MEAGPNYGYFQSPAKSFFICKDKNERIARAVVSARNLDAQFTQGHISVGGFYGSGEMEKIGLRKILLLGQQIWSHLSKWL